MLDCKCNGWVLKARLMLHETFWYRAQLLQHLLAEWWALFDNLML